MFCLKHQLAVDSVLDCCKVTSNTDHKQVHFYTKKGLELLAVIFVNLLTFDFFIPTHKLKNQSAKHYYTVGPYPPHSLFSSIKEQAASLTCFA